MLPGANEGFLCNLFRGHMILHDGNGQSEDAALEAPDERRC